MGAVRTVIASGVAAVPRGARRCGLRKANVCNGWKADVFSRSTYSSRNDQDLAVRRAHSPSVLSHKRRPRRELHTQLSAGFLHHGFGNSRSCRLALHWSDRRCTGSRNDWLCGAALVVGHGLPNYAIKAVRAINAALDLNRMLKLLEDESVCRAIGTDEHSRLGSALSNCRLPPHLSSRSGLEIDAHPRRWETSGRA